MQFTSTSELVANQVHKDYKCSSPELSEYLAELRKLEKRFDGIEVRHVYRKGNIEPDNLARRASRRELLEPGTFLDILMKPSVKEANDEGSTVAPDISLGAIEAEHVVADIETTDDWWTPLIKFLSSDELPEDDAEAEKITRQAKIYCMISDDLYKKAPNGVLLKCISSDDGKHLLLDIHKGIYGSHAAGRTFVGKAFRQGFFWPTALRDTYDMVQRCEAYQFHGKHTRLLAQALQTIPLTWPFSCWGSTYSDHSHEDKAATSSCLCPSTNSPSGLRQRPQEKSRPIMPSSLSKGYSADMDCLTAS
jgi:hypothetical protein